MPKTNQTMFEIDLLPKIRQYLNNQITWKQLYEFIRQNAELRVAELDLTNRCNLGCKHCFYTAEGGEELPFEDWRKIIRKLEKHVSIISVVGKEPLLYKDVIKVLKVFDRIKKQKKDEKKQFGYTMVTNGLLLDVYIDELAKLDIDFLDVSLDGWGEAHDKLRGKGVFKRVLNNLMLAVDAGLADKIFIDSTLIEDNSQAILKLVKELSKREIKNFSIAMYFPTPFTDMFLMPSISTLLKFVKNLRKILKSIKISAQISIDIRPPIHCVYLPYLIDNKIIKVNDIWIDELGNFFVEKRYASSALFFRFSFIDPAYWQYVRIKSGEWLGSCEPLILPGTLWKQFSVGNAVDEPIEELYKKALDKPLQNVIKIIDELKKTYSKSKAFKYCLPGGFYYQVLRKGLQLGLFSKQVYDKILKITLEGRK